MRLPAGLTNFPPNCQDDPTKLTAASNFQHGYSITGYLVFLQQCGWTIDTCISGSINLKIIEADFIPFIQMKSCRVDSLAGDD